MSFLEELYYGNIDPSAKQIKSDSEYQKQQNELWRCIDLLFLSLNNEQKGLCDEIGEYISQLDCIAQRESFIQGFRMGAQMAWEIVNFQSKEFSAISDQ